MKNVVILGSTGSIGRQALDVLRAFPDEFRVLALAGGHNSHIMAAQAREFSPKYIGMRSESAAGELKQSFPGIEIIGGADAASMIAALPEADAVIHGISGFAGMKPLLSALDAGRRVALANKESVICARPLIRAAEQKGGGMILPVDSEQCAIFQCLAAGKRAEVKRFILTASGGPFFGKTGAQLKSVAVDEALAHPVWRMGKKITIDSATLFNKGLEVLEAASLFDADGGTIDVVVHPEGVVHSLVEFADGASIAQLSKPDMRLALQYALTWPERLPGNFGGIDLAARGKLSFYEPDTETFRALPLAYEALEEGGALPVAYNAANEVAVEAFAAGRIGFMDIAETVARTMDATQREAIGDIGDIIRIDAESRERAKRSIG